MDTETIKALIQANREAGLPDDDGLTSAEVGAANRRIMFGEDGEGFPSEDEWSAWVD